MFQTALTLRNIYQHPDGLTRRRIPPVWIPGQLSTPSDPRTIWLSHQQQRQVLQYTHCVLISTIHPLCAYALSRTIVQAIKHAPRSYHRGYHTPPCLPTPLPAWISLCYVLQQTFQLQVSTSRPPSWRYLVWTYANTEALRTFQRSSLKAALPVGWTPRPARRSSLSYDQF